MKAIQSLHAIASWTAVVGYFGIPVVFFVAPVLLVPAMALALVGTVGRNILSRHPSMSMSKEEVADDEEDDDNPYSMDTFRKQAMGKVTVGTALAGDDEDWRH